MHREIPTNTANVRTSRDVSDELIDPGNSRRIGGRGCDPITLSTAIFNGKGVKSASGIDARLKRKIPSKCHRKGRNSPITSRANGRGEGRCLERVSALSGTGEASNRPTWLNKMTRIVRDVKRCSSVSNLSLVRD
jgi:hypothetical protein